MENDAQISNMIRKMTGLIDREEIRNEVSNQIGSISLLANPEEFKELISRFIRFPDGLETLRKEWRIIYNNSKKPEILIEVLAQDTDIRTAMFNDMNYLINCGEIWVTSSLSKEIAKLPEGKKVIVSNFEQLFSEAQKNLEELVLPMLEEEEGRQKFRENFDRIKTKFLEARNIEGFFKTINELESLEDCKDIYEEYGFWSKLYSQIQVPKMKFILPSQALKLSSAEAEKAIGDSIAEEVKLQEFIRMLNSPDRYEKRAVLEAVSNGNPYTYKACGTSSFIIKAGNQVVKLCEGKRKYEVPYHPRIMMPWFRKKYSDNSVLEVFNYGNTKSADITDDILLEIYKEFEAAGIKWGDARKTNLLVLESDNDLPDFIKSSQFNLFGFLEDDRFPTNNHKALKKGDLVVCDLDMLYAVDDPEYQEGLLDEVIEKYLYSKKIRQQEEIDR